MYEQYHPLGIVGVVSAFNFPVAVWAVDTLLHGFVGTFVFGSLRKTPLWNCLSKYNRECFKEE